MVSRDLVPSRTEQQVRLAGPLSFNPLFLRGQRRRALRRAAEMRRLLERIGQRQQFCLAPWLARMSMPTGTPSGAVLVGAENPAGTVIAGKPVTDARMPFRSAWLSSVTGTTSRFCKG